MDRSLSITIYSLNKTTIDDFTTSFKSDFITSSFIFSKSRLNCNWVIINSSYFVFVVENIVSQGVNITLFVYPFLLHNYMDLIQQDKQLAQQVRALEQQVREVARQGRELEHHGKENANQDRKLERQGREL